MSSVKRPTKRTEHASKGEHVTVVTHHRLAETHSSAVFPEHAGESTWHSGPRNGHPGKGDGKARGR
jgi:hypothetical protein